jgi:phage-related protein
MRWAVETLDEVVDAELEALPVSLRARMLRLMEMVENVGLENMREPHVKHIEGKLWELRAKAADGIARGLYTTATGRRVIVLHVFVKKSQQMPRRALDIARQRMKKVKDTTAGG